MIKITYTIQDFCISFVPTTYSVIYWASIKYTVKEFTCAIQLLPINIIGLSICSQEIILNGLATQEADEIPNLGS